MLVAEPDAWFTYYYWLDDARAPDFARTVEIHRKPGYDPAELFFDPADKLVKAEGRRRAAAQEARLPLLDAASSRSTRVACAARTAGCPDDARTTRRVLLCSDPALARDRIAATEVRDLLLELAGVPAGAAAG